MGYPQPRTLVITLFSGEQELGLLKDSLISQTYKNWSHEIISFLPEVEAHRKLREQIETRKDEFDLFIKLDADMVFNSDDSLRKIVDFFVKEPRLDHLVTPVFDIPSSSNIYGAHFYRSGVYFPYGGDGLFTDPNPRINGIRYIEPINTKAYINHMQDPSDKQAFLLGVHRILKVVQRDRIIKDYDNAKFQMNYISAIADTNKVDPSKVRELVLCGAESVFTSTEKLFHKDLKKEKGVEDQELLKKQIYNWESDSKIFKQRIFRYTQLPKFWSIPLLHIYKLVYKLYKIIKVGI